MLVHVDHLPKSGSRRARAPRVEPGTSTPSSPGSLVSWYIGLTSHWMNAGPRVRNRLLLRTHEWIVDRVLAPGVGLAAAVADLRPDGALTRTLMDLVPADEAERWRHFVHVIVANLRHAVLLPVTRRNEAWIRWLFLIPYSVKYAPEPETAPAARPAAPTTEPCSGA